MEKKNIKRPYMEKKNIKRPYIDGKYANPGTRYISKGDHLTKIQSLKRKFIAIALTLGIALGVGGTILTQEAISFRQQYKVEMQNREQDQYKDQQRVLDLKVNNINDCNQIIDFVNNYKRENLYYDEDTSAILDTAIMNATILLAQINGDRQTLRQVLPNLSIEEENNYLSKNDLDDIRKSLDLLEKDLSSLGYNELANQQKTNEK